MSLKEHRKIAKFYGSKALTGSAKQKEWAEKLRADVLTSDMLSDEEKAEFLDTANFLQSAKFWINNKDLEKSYFTKENLVKEFVALRDLSEKHNDVLARSGAVGPKEKAKDEIKKLLTENKFQFGYEIAFPNFDPMNHWGVFEK